MKVISPWFGTARLISGIRKAYSEMQSGRSDGEHRERDDRLVRTSLQQGSSRKSGETE